MDYCHHYNYQEQGNYLDADTSRYFEHKLSLVLQVTFKLIN